MDTEETNDKGGKAKSAGCGFAPMGRGMFEMMSACCTDRGGSIDCSTMMKDMMEKMRIHPCCPPETGRGCGAVGTGAPQEPSAVSGCGCS
jgi:hypothetical protein